MRIWRISNYADLTGRGGLLKAGRWNAKGSPIVYCCDHPSTCLLEALVHFDLDEIPENYQLLEIEIDEAQVERVLDLPADWQTDKSACHKRWETFKSSGAHVAIAVPSIVMPKASNILLNPEHTDAWKVRIEDVHRIEMNERFKTL